MSAYGNRVIKKSEFQKIWLGYIVCAERGEKWKQNLLQKKQKNKYYDILKNNKNLLFVVAILSVLLSIFMVISASLFRYTIDNYILDNGMVKNNSFFEEMLSFVNNLDKMFILLMIIYILKSIIFLVRGGLLAKLEKNVDCTIKNKFVEKSLTLPIAYYNDRDSGEMINRYDSIAMITGALSEAGISVFLELFMLVVSATILFNVDKGLFLTATFIALFYAVIVLFYKKPLNNLNRQCMEEETKITTCLKECIDGLETIKCLRAENSSIRKFYKKIYNNVESVYKINIYKTSLSSIIMSIESITVLIILFEGSKMVMNGQMTLGTLIMFESFLGFFLSPVESLVEMLPALQEVFIAFDRLDDVLDVKSEKTDFIEQASFENSSVKLVAENVIYRYGYGENVLNGISCKINQGEKVFLIGESGSGKSTFAKLLAGLQKPTNGSVGVEEHGVYNSKGEKLRSSIIYTSQNTFIFSGTLKDNLTMGLESYNDDELHEIVQLCGINDMLLQRNWSLNSYISEEGRNLSGGEKQRVAIARALLRHGEIYIFDEATCHMDKYLENQIIQYIYKKLKDKVCIFIMHNSEYLGSCDYIYVLEAGEIVAKGKYTELIKNKYVEKYCQLI